MDLQGTTTRRLKIRVSAVDAPSPPRPRFASASQPILPLATEPQLVCTSSHRGGVSEPIGGVGMGWIVPVLLLVPDSS